MTRAWNLALVVALAASVALSLGARPAAADGDPASDVLITQWTFVPFGAPVSKPVTAQLEETVARARRAGYPIKVAIIGASYDLGAVPQLFGKPQAYAKFLSRELVFVYRGRLLIAMPNAFGYHDSRKRSGPEQRILGSLKPREGADELVMSATQAVARLAAANGHPIAIPKLEGVKKSGGRRTWLAIAAGAIAACILLGVGLAVWLRRAAKASAETAPTDSRT